MAQQPLLKMRRSHGRNATYTEGLIRRARNKTLTRDLPKYLRKDADRAKSRFNMSVYFRPKSSFARSYHADWTTHGTVILGGRKSREWKSKGSHKARVLSVLRHEIGHSEAIASKRDSQRLKRHGTSSRDEFHAWKNAIRASKRGNIAWPLVHAAMSSYHFNDQHKVKRDIAVLKRYQRLVRRVRRKK